MKHKLRNNILLALTMLLLVVSANAQVKVLTLDEAIKIALEQNSARINAELEVQKAQADVNTAYGYAMPSVDLSASYSHFFEKPQVPFLDFEALLNNSTYGVLFDEELLAYDANKIQDMGTEMMSMALSNNMSAEIQISQILFNSAVIKGVGSASTYFDMAKYMLEQEAANIVYQVTTAFYGCVLAKEMLAITEESLTNFEKNYNSVLSYYEYGFASEYDKLNAEVQYENFKPTVNRARSGKLAALNGLKVLLGMNPSNEIDVNGALEYKKEDWLENTLIKEAVENNYMLGLLEYQQKMNDAFIDLEKSDYFPTVAAFGSYSINGQSDDWDYMTYNQALAGVSFSMNLFTGMQTKNKVQKKKIERLQTDETLRQAKDAIIMQIRNKINDIDLIEANIASAEKNVKLAKKGYEIAQVRYQEGDGTQLELTNAELQYRSAKTNILSYYYEYMSASEDVKFLTGSTSGKYIEDYKTENYKIK